MNVIYPHRRQTTHAHRESRQIRRIVCIAAICLISLALINGGLYFVYRNRTYPRTTMGNVSVGNATYDRVAAIAEQQRAVPSTLQLVHGTQKASLNLKTAGEQTDTDRTKMSVEKSRSWLPLVAIFTKHVVAVPVTFAPDQFQKAMSGLTTSFHTAPTNAKVVLNGSTFSATDSQNGADLDTHTFLAAVLQAIDRGQTTLNPPITSVAPSTTKAQANATAQKLQHTLDTPITYTYGSGSQKTTPADIVSWYKPNNDTYILDDFTIRTFIANAGNKMGIHPEDLTTAVAKTKQAVSDATATSVALQPFATTKTYGYCVQSRGVDASQLDALKAKLASTYADLRGWSLDGQVQFKYATAGCDFTVWLASPAQMPTFGAICDSYWDCEVDNNVVVNADRWSNTTPAWQSYGGSLEDYRVMLINHETGHMLGFQHWTCPGKGQPAPVMMQESINLQGCVFNIWPTQPELDTLRRHIGL